MRLDLNQSVISTTRLNKLASSTWDMINRDSFSPSVINFIWRETTARIEDSGWFFSFTHIPHIDNVFAYDENFEDRS